MRISLVFVRQNIFCGGRTSIFAEECLSRHPLVKTSPWHILEEVNKDILKRNLFHVTVYFNILT